MDITPSFTPPEHYCTPGDSGRRVTELSCRHFRELFRHEISRSLFDDFEDAMSMREAADYGLVFSEEGARDVLKTAEAFKATTKSVLRARMRRRFQWTIIRVSSTSRLLTTRFVITTTQQAVHTVLPSDTSFLTRNRKTNTESARLSEPSPEITPGKFHAGHLQHA